MPTYGLLLIRFNLTSALILSCSDLMNLGTSEKLCGHASREAGYSCK